MPTVLWEVIQPISGPNIYTDFLNQNGEGVHHLLFECEGISWNEKIQGLQRAGYTCIQSGNGSVRRHMPISILPSLGTLIEIVDIASGWKRPEPEEVYR